MGSYKRIICSLNVRDWRRKEVTMKMSHSWKWSNQNKNQFIFKMSKKPPRPTPSPVNGKMNIGCNIKRNLMKNSNNKTISSKTLIKPLSHKHRFEDSGTYKFVQKCKLTFKWRYIWRLSSGQKESLNTSITKPQKSSVLTTTLSDYG